MTYQNGEISPRTEDEWLETMIEAADPYFDSSLLEREGTAVHQYYRPVAAQFVELEEDLQDVLNALRVQDATGEDLDLLGEQLGVSRRQASRAEGFVTFSREESATQDYIIQAGTNVQTNGLDPLVFTTTETVTLSQGTTQVDAPITAEEPGTEGNVAAGTITSSVSFPTGVQSVTNSNATSTGRNVEEDSAYRERVIETVAKTETTSGYNIFRKLSSLDYVRDVQYIDNSEDVSGSGLSAHEAEVVIDAGSGHDQEIAQMIFENTPLGVNLVGGVHGQAASGTATLPNGQSFTIPFSKPTQVGVYVDVSVETTQSVNDSKVKNAITEYIGGELDNGQVVLGDLGVADDVVHGEVEFAIRTIDGVYDVTSLTIGTSSSPTGTSNLAMTTEQRARTDPSLLNISSTVI
jgi:uncharacterized phage protein gp47/JayE